MKFYLAHKRFEKAPIFIDVAFRKIRFRYTTGISVLRKHWNLEKEIVTGKDIDFAFKNHKLARIKESVSKLVASSKYINEEITLEEFKNQLLNILNPSKQIVANNSTEAFISLMEKWILKREETNQVSAKTIENYKNNLNFLIGFEKHTNRTIHLYDFNTNFKEELTIYAYKVRNLSNSTLHSYYKNIRMVTAYLKDTGFKFNDIFLVNDIKEEPNNELITLSIEQVKQLKNYKPKNKAEELFHDLIVLQLETGQRISDIKRLNSSMIIEKNSKKYITFKQEKTGIEVILPCTDTIDIILKKYNGKIPKFDLKELNKRLKKISKSLEFNNEFTIKKRQGKEVTTKIMKLHEIISTHKLRSTVITLLDDNSTSISSIMNIAGHKELETTSKYLKQDKLTSAESFRSLLEETK